MMKRVPTSALILLFGCLATAAWAADAIMHRFHNPTVDAGNPNETGPDEWNDSLIVTGGTNGQFLQRDSTKPDGWGWSNATPSVVAIIGGPMAGCQGSTPFSFWNFKATETPTFSCTGGSNIQDGTLDFADSGKECAYAHARMPVNYNSTGVTTAVMDWMANVADGTKNAVLTLETACVGDGESLDPTFNAAQPITQSAHATANRKRTTSWPSVTMTGCASGEQLDLKVCRLPADAADTLGVTLNGLSFEISIPRQ